MGFSLIPRQLKFFDLFDQTSDIVRRAAEKFYGLVSQFDRVGERCYEIREDQNACHEITRRTVTAVDESFVTPFDRENIHELAQSVNDLVSAIEESAARFEVFGIDRPTSQAVVLARMLQDCCVHVADSLRLCREWKNAPQVMGHVHEIHRLDGEVDRTCRECDRALFAAPPDLLQLIKWRELYASIKDAVNAARRVSQCLSEIMVKGG